MKGPNLETHLFDGQSVYIFSGSLKFVRIAREYTEVNLRFVLLTDVC